MYVRTYYDAGDEELNLCLCWVEPHRATTITHTANTHNTTHHTYGQRTINDIDDNDYYDGWRWNYNFVCGVIVNANVARFRTDLIRTRKSRKEWTTRGWIQPAKSNTNDDDADFIVKLPHTRHTLYALLYSTLYTLSAHRRYQPTLGLYNIVVFLGCWCLCCFFYLLFIFQLPLFRTQRVSECLFGCVFIFSVCCRALAYEIFSF